MNEWLQKLKPGDEVCVDYPLGGKHIAKVERLTATQIIAADRKWRRDTGRVIGSDERYMVPYLREATQDRREEIERKYLIESIQRRSRFNKVSIENLRAAWELLK